MTAPSDFNSISELDATLVFRVAYDGSSYSGFAEQPGQTTVAVSCVEPSRRCFAVRSI